MFSSFAELANLRGGMSDDIAPWPRRNALAARTSLGLANANFLLRFSALLSTILRRGFDLMPRLLDQLARHLSLRWFRLGCFGRVIIVRHYYFPLRFLLVLLFGALTGPFPNVA